ncbi:MAG: type II secretion system GspH family protein [Gammaproteobacteria bacterium]|nr:type II secretion system GspH family protein [Gammaproteobacteria bacterium]
MHTGFTLIELLVVISIIAMLLTIAVPRYFRSLDQSKETVLRQDLTVLRDAIDKHVADKGQYPESLLALVEQGYIRKIPDDPFTKSSETWVLVQSDDPESAGVRDVQSGAEGAGISGVPFDEF